MGRWVVREDVRAVLARVHHEERGVAIAEVVVVLSLVNGVVVGLRVVQLERVGRILERRERRVALSGVVVDDLPQCQLMCLCSVDDVSHLMIVVCMDDR